MEEFGAQVALHRLFCMNQDKRMIRVGQDEVVDSHTSGYVLKILGIVPFFLGLHTNGDIMGLLASFQRKGKGYASLLMIQNPVPECCVLEVFQSLR